MSGIRKNDFEELINSIYQTHCVLQENALKTINYNLTVRNWLIGCYIIEFEQSGKDRAKYGTSLLEEIAKKLKNKGLKGFSISALKNHRTFYLYYPQIRQSLIGEFQNLEFQDKSSIPIKYLFQASWKESIWKFSEKRNQPIFIILNINLKWLKHHPQKFSYSIPT